MVQPMLMMLHMTVMEKPTCENIVQNMMPMDSPQETRQKQSSEETRKTDAVRLRLMGKAMKTPKTSEVRNVKGISSRV